MTVSSVWKISLNILLSFSPTCHHIRYTFNIAIRCLTHIFHGLSIMTYQFSIYKFRSTSCKRDFILSRQSYQNWVLCKRFFCLFHETLLYFLRKRHSPSAKGRKLWYKLAIITYQTNYFLFFHFGNTCSLNHINEFVSSVNPIFQTIHAKYGRCIFN